MSLRADRPARHASRESSWAPDEAAATGATGGAALYTDAVRMRPDLLERVRAEHEVRTGAAATGPQRLPPPPNAGRPRPVVRGSVVAEVFGNVEPVHTDGNLARGLGVQGAAGVHKHSNVFDVYYSDDGNDPMVLASWKREPNAKWSNDTKAKYDSYSASARPASAVYTNGAFRALLHKTGHGAETLNLAIVEELRTVFGADYEEMKKMNYPFTPAEPSDIMGKSMAMGFPDVSETGGAAEVNKIIGPSKKSNATKTALQLSSLQDVKKGMFGMKKESAVAKQNMKPYLMQPTGRDDYPKDRKNPGDPSSVFGLMAVLPTVTKKSGGGKIMVYLPHELREGDEVRDLAHWSFRELPSEQVESVFGARVVPVAIEQDSDGFAYGHTLWLARGEFGAYKKRLSTKHKSGKGAYRANQFAEDVGIYKYKGIDKDVETFINVPMHYAELKIDAEGTTWLMPAALVCALGVADSTDSKDTLPEAARTELLNLIRAPKGWMTKGENGLVAPSQDELVAKVAGGPDFPDEIQKKLKDKHTDLMSLWTATTLVSEMNASGEFDKVLKSGKTYQMARKVAVDKAKKAKKAAADAAHDAKKKSGMMSGVFEKMKNMPVFKKKPTEPTEAACVADLIDALVDEELGPAEVKANPFDGYGDDEW